jgi:hypothetical protein
MLSAQFPFCGVGQKADGDRRGAGTEIGDKCSPFNDGGHLGSQFTSESHPSSCKKGMIVEDFNLYLDDVRHPQRMSATMVGMKAAATVPKKHGIDSHRESLAD